MAEVSVFIKRSASKTPRRPPRDSYKVGDYIRIIMGGGLSYIARIVWKDSVAVLAYNPDFNTGDFGWLMGETDYCSLILENPEYRGHLMVAIYADIRPAERGDREWSMR